jgi:hypothetical protein
MKLKINIEIEVDVEGRFTKGDPGCLYLSNGDPGHEPTPDEFEIHSVKWDDIDITDKLQQEDYNFIEDNYIDAIKNQDPFDY